MFASSAILYFVVVSQAKAIQLSKADTQGTGNLCVDGRIAPELILIGAPRCSTTTFAVNFVRSPETVFGQCTRLEKAQSFLFRLHSSRERVQRSNLTIEGCSPEGIKEMHWFNANFQEGPQAKAAYLAHFPACQTQSRLVAADLTPSHHTKPEVPVRIANVYGTQASKIKFITLVRDPMQQLHSFYYYEHQEEKHSFKSFVESLVKSPPTSGDYGRYVNNANIAGGIQNFLNVFKPSQLYVVPFQYETTRKNGMPRAHEFMWDALGVPHAPQHEEIEGVNGHPHPHVSDEKKNIDQAAWSKFAQIVYDMTGKDAIAKVIANAGGGMNLYGYKGSHTDVEKIAAWIGDGW
jgi:hypothetical protein